MGRGIEKLRELIGIIKDKASQSKAILSQPSTVSLHLTLLRATTHDPHAPPSAQHLNALLCFGNGSRATSSAVVKALMDRLQRTGDSSVAIKCLIAVHHIVKHGTFHLRDHLAGGRNHLNLSNFRDASTPTSWELSCWVRWFAHYVEHLACTSTILGFFPCSSSDHQALSSLTSSELLKQTDSLVGLVEAICKKPDSQYIENGNKIVIEIMCLVGDDYFSAVKEISVRVSELGRRLGQLGFGESVDLLFGLKRIEECKEKTAAMVTRKKAMMEAFWGSITEMKEMVWSRSLSSGEFEGSGRFLKNDQWVSGSGRFPRRVMRPGDSVLFPSARFGGSVSCRFPFQSIPC